MDFFAKIFGKPVEGIAPADAQARLKQKNRPFVLDVREVEEFRGGHITGARLIPLGELKGRTGELPKDREILCVCQSGSRSTQAARKLKTAGFEVINLNGGMTAWARAGLPMKKGG